MIAKLRVRAFKGLREFNIDPDRVNLLIGANGTGKTNFADLVSFVSLLPVLGLPATIDKFDGLDQVRTRQPRAGRPYRLEVEIHLNEDRSRGLQEARYLFALAQSGELRVQREELDAVVYKRKPGKPARQGVPRFDVEQPIRLAFRREGTNITDWSETLGPRLGEFETSLASGANAGRGVRHHNSGALGSVGAGVLVNRGRATESELLRATTHRPGPC
jgi:predicted ATPase